MSQRIQTSLLIFVLIALYFIGLNDRGMFHDGYLYAAYGKHALLQGKWLIPHLSKSTYNEFFQHIPFLFVLEGLFFKIMGVSYATARMFVLLFLITTVFVSMKFLQKEKNHEASIFWIILFLTLPPLLKKARFPNIDIPLMLWTTLALFEGYKAIAKDKVNRWWGCGMFFGFALLTKGPLASQIILALLAFLVWEKKLSLLKSWRPWAGLLLGFMVFALWPLALYLNHRFDIFENWYRFIFIESILEGRGEKTPFLTYVFFLLKNAPLWFGLAISGIYFHWKGRMETDSLWRMCWCWFLSLIIPLSFAGLKYSNYLIPSYPALAILACYPLFILSGEVRARFQKWVLPIALLGFVISLVFVNVYKSHRDEVIYRALDYSRDNDLNHYDWVLYNQCYPFFSLQNLLAFEESAAVYQVDQKPSIGRSALVIIHKADVSRVSDIKVLKDLEAKDLVLACSDRACPN